MTKKKRRYLRFESGRNEWVVDYGGRKFRRRKYFESRREAEEFMQSDEFLIAIGLKIPMVAEKASCEESMPIEEAAKWYLANVTDTQKSKYSQIWEPMVFRKLAVFFRGKQIHEIGLADLLEYQSYLLNKEKLAPQTVNRRFNSIRSFFKTFQKTRSISNPCRDLKKLKVAEKPLEIVLDDVAMNKLILAAKAWLRPIIHVAKITGMRRSELVRLRVPALHLEEGYLIVEASEGFKTKNLKSRRLPLTEELTRIFTPLITEARKTGRTGANDHLFLDDRGKPISPDRLTREMKKLLKRVLKVRAGAVHILRHSALTSMIRHGADIESVRRIAGHSSLTITQRYLSAADEQLRLAMARSMRPNIGGKVALGGAESKVMATNEN